MSRSPLPASASVPALTSPHLLGAALAGLLCLTGCSGKDVPEPSGSENAAGKANQSAGAGGTETASSQGGAGATAAAGEDAGGETTAGGASAAGGAGDVGGSAGAGVAGTAAAAGAPAAGTGGSGGAPAEVPHITSSENVGVMTEEQFKALCDQRGGTVEVMPHCGGFASAQGFSYDSTTSLLSEHTCHGANTCAGWNCAIPD